jgi:hypothetical protein
MSRTVVFLDEESLIEDLATKRRLVESELSLWERKRHWAELRLKAAKAIEASSSVAIHPPSAM